MDTTAAPILASLGGLQITTNVEGAGGHSYVITGVPYATVSVNTTAPIIGTTGTEGMTTTVAANDGGLGRTYGFALKTMNSSMALGRGYSLFSQGVTPPTPSCSESAGGSVPQPATWYYAIAPVYANGSEGKFSLTCNATTSSGNRTITLNWTAMSGVIGYNVYRGPAANNLIAMACANPDTTSNSYTDTAAFPCGGQSAPTTASGGPAGIQNGKSWAADFVLGATTAPTGQTLATHLYMDSTLNWPSFKPNGNTAMHCWALMAV